MIWVLLLVGCFHNPLRVTGPHYVPSESPCLDGTLVNVAGHGCESLYFGFVPGSKMFKMKCYYSEEDNFWTTSDFYFVPYFERDEFINPLWIQMCSDKIVDTYFVRMVKIKPEE